MSINFKSAGHLSQFLMRWLIILVLSTTPLIGGCEMEWRDLKASQVFGDTLEAKLATAAAQGNSQLIRELVKQGANVNASGVQNMTPLGWAMISGNLEGTKAILEAGANPNQPFGEKIVWYPVFYACMMDRNEFLKVLLKYKANPNLHGGGSDFSPLVAALSDLNKVKILVEAGADVNAGADQGYQLGVSAVYRQDYETLSYLLEKGHRVNLPLIAWEIKNQYTEPKKIKIRDKILSQLEQVGVIPPETAPLSLRQLMLKKTN